MSTAQDVMCCAIKEQAKHALRIALQVNKESNIQRARARGLRKNAKKARQGMVWWVTSDAPSTRQLSSITFSSESACSRVLFAPAHTAYAARPGTRHCTPPAPLAPRRRYGTRLRSRGRRTCSQAAGSSGGKQVVAITRARPTRYAREKRQRM